MLPKRIEFNIISEQVLAIELIITLLNTVLFSLSLMNNYSKAEPLVFLSSFCHQL